MLVRHQGTLSIRYSLFIRLNEALLCIIWWMDSGYVAVTNTGSEVVMAFNTAIAGRNGGRLCCLYITMYPDICAELV